MKKLAPGLIGLALVISVAAYIQGSTHPQGSGGSGPAKAPTPARWEGIIIRSSSDQSTLTVRERSSGFVKIIGLEKTIHYDSSTEWTSAEHGSKKYNKITRADVKDGDRVICIGIYDEKGEFLATFISKRLSPYRGRP
jgi:hypothetical protein